MVFRQVPALAAARWLPAVLPVVVMLVACSGPAPAPPIHPAEESARLGSELPWCGDPVPGAAGVRVDPVAAGLDVPWGIQVASDGRIFVTERPGRIRVIRDGILDPQPWAEMDVYAESEAGMMGIALDPDFPETGHLYVAVTVLRYPLTGPGRLLGAAVRRVERLLGGAGAVTELQLVRFTEQDGRGADPVVVLGGIPAFQLHAGAAVAFAPDGTLYLTMGDAGLPGTAADPSDLRGTILRIRPDGSIPADNPIPGSPVLAWGFRDVQGLAWAPGSGRLWATEHGPTGLEPEGYRTDRDELNRVESGGDHGWPRVSGRVDLKGTVVPVVEWTPAIAPSGLAFITDPASPWFGNAFVAALRGMQLRRVVLDHDTDSPVCQEVLLEGVYGRLRGVHEAPDGSLLVTTSNRDGRGAPGPDDDLLLRVRPGAAAAREASGG